MDEFRGKVVLVTGGTGSIGSGIIRELLGREVRRIIVLSRDEIAQFMMKRTLTDHRLCWHVGDIRDKECLERIFDMHKMDIIYHAAAMKHVTICEEWPVEAVKTNILGTQNLLDIAQRHEFERLIVISTDKAVYPTNVMGASKFIAERMTLNAAKRSKSGQVFSCVRFGNVLGSRGSVIPAMIQSLILTKRLYVTNSNVTRFGITISDAVRLIFEATRVAQGGEIFVFKMKAFRLGDLVDIIINRVAPKLSISRDQIEICNTGLLPGEKLHETLVTEEESRNLYELNRMYLLLEERADLSRYKNPTKAELSAYTSRDSELLTAEDLERLVAEFLKSNFLTSIDYRDKHVEI
mgnify:CR=1 FL=1